MDKKWVYALMLFAAIGMIVAAGSVAAAEHGAAATSAGDAAAGVASGGASPSSSIHSGNYPPNFEWYVVTSSADATSTLVYTVPSGYRFQIDDVSISYVGNTGSSGISMYRGPTGNNQFLFTNLNPYSHYEHSFQNLILNSGEQLSVRSWYSGTVSTAWTITGHWIY
jgi:hypothetical protein